jgi:glutamyl aminopeptidase
MKAKYKISLVSPDNDGYHALSNMDIENTEPYAAGLVKYNFKESVPMSTYLTVFIVSDFKNRTGQVNVGKPVGKPLDLSIYATPGQFNKTEYAFDISKDIIEFYIQYFNIDYPLPKLDLAAIPDFVR